MKQVPRNEIYDDSGASACVFAAIGCGVIICSSFAAAVTVAILWWVGVL